MTAHDHLPIMGCRFPVDPECAVSITREATKVGRRLAREGAIGRFALDFVVVRNEACGWDAYAIELNAVPVIGRVG